ncbi:MAG: DUF547 domain-containing protein [Pseudomonadota bacterium]
MPLRAALAAASLIALTPSAFAMNDPIERYGQFAETRSFTVDYSPMDALAQVFGVEERGRFKPAYDVLGGDGKAPMAQYLSYLAQFDTARMTRDDQLAYWLNVRNLLVLQAIGDERSRRGFEEKRGHGAAPGEMWTAKRFRHGDIELSINDIERRILLAHFEDPNIIYGLYQATADSPALVANGFRGDTVRQQLADAGRDFVNSRDGLRLRRGRAELAQVFEWYQDDLFGGDHAAMVAHVSQFLDAEDQAKLQAAEEIQFQKFNYRIEEFRPRQQQFSGGGFGGGGGGGGFGS